MSVIRLYTWLDVEAVFTRRRHAGDWRRAGITGVSVYPNEVDVRLLEDEDRKKAKDAISDWFGPRFDAPAMSIILETAPGGARREIPVNLELGDKEPDPVPRPSFGNVSYYPVEGWIKERPGPLPAGTPPIIAFYSYKGGVGRTLHLIGLVKALSERSEPKRPRLLIVDADLEAPGLTWLVRQKTAPPEISFIDFLALANYDASEAFRESLKLTSAQLKTRPLNLKTPTGLAEQYFLPAFREPDQALHMPIRPEHMTQMTGRQWVIGDLLALLGKELGVSAVVVDLRAGLSELSSPLLFDPRIVRVLVTTASRQSIEGTKLVLGEMRKLSPRPVVEPSVAEKVATYQTDDRSDVTGDQGEHYPCVIMSMIPQELSTSQEIARVREELQEVFPDYAPDLMTPPRLRVEESAFANELLYISSMDSALAKLAGTSVQKLIDTLAAEWVPVPALRREPTKAPSRNLENALEDARRKLEKTAQRFEFAESGEGTEFLRTPPLRALSEQYQFSPPTALVIGAKGSGKTFVYLQLSRLKTWSGFLEKFNLPQKGQWLCWPLLQCGALKGKAKELVDDCRAATRKALGVGDGPQHTWVLDQVRDMLKDQSQDASDWRRFWLRLIAYSIGIEVGREDPLSLLHERLDKTDARLVVLVDGLEEVFLNVATDEAQQTAVRSLCQDVVNHLGEMATVKSRLGLLAFIRRDLIRASFTQNAGQVEALYSQFELRWNSEEALRLAVWLCRQAGIDEFIDLSKDLEEAPRAELENALLSVWGLKLGGPKSREAYTANWVIDALSDFNGQLQARDVVRLMRYAARRARGAMDFEGRVLPPASIRGAIDPCSEGKIREIKDEIPRLTDVFKKFKKRQDRSIPFRADEFDLTPEEVSFLKSVGIVLETSEEGGKFYMPEIFRRGLGFTLERGARPRVLSLMKRALAKQGSE
ncbi:MAG: hypothetical protein M1598_00800 [Actinobacteria bacterium]|nr:hypothetical protein [Actinomycetota bacterium]